MDIGSLTEKKGPLPVWAWAMITAGILYLLYRHFKGRGGSSTGTPAVATTDTSTGSSVASPPVDVPSGPVDTSGNSITPVDTLPNTVPYDNTLLPWWADPSQWPTDPVMPLGSGNPSDPGTVDGTPVLPGHSIAKGRADFSPTGKPGTTARTTKPALKSIIPGINGRVVSQKVLPSGAKLVTLAGGKQIEQAKGKKAYVVRKGK